MRNTCKIAALLIVILLSLFQTVAAQMTVKQIQDLIAEGKFDQALSETDAILAKDPDNIQALFMKGLIYTRSNQMKQAEETFLLLSKKNPELPEPYNNLAVIYASQGEFEKAREALQKAINTHPSYATAHENIGDIYAKMASQAYNQALELDDSNIAAREKLSLINELFSVSAGTSTATAAVAEAKTPEIINTIPPAPTTAPVSEPVIEVPSVAAVEPGQVPEKIPVPEPIQTQTRQITPIIINNVNNWARAWSSKDVDGYLSFYAPEYSPSELTREDWITQRKERISSPRYITVDVNNLEVIMHGDEHAQAVFLQKYTSDTYSDSVNKTLLFRKLNDRWLIVQEKSD